jgi:dolichol kinase
VEIVFTDGMNWLFKMRKHARGPVVPVLRQRSDLHLARKCFHMSGAVGLLVPYLYFGASRELMVAVLGILLGVVMSVEYARTRWGWVNNIVLIFMRPLLRDTEVRGLSGIPFYIASSLFAFLIFPHHIAVLSILYLALGDPSSSFFGVLYGRSKLFPNKSLQGTLGGFMVCALVTLVYLWLTGLAQEKIAVLVLIGGFAGSLAELLPLNIDDNFSIPVVSGGIIYLAFWMADIPLF